MKTIIFLLQIRAKDDYTKSLPIERHFLAQYQSPVYVISGSDNDEKKECGRHASNYKEKIEKLSECNSFTYVTPRYTKR